MTAKTAINYSVGIWWWCRTLKRKYLYFDLAPSFWIPLVYSKLITHHLTEINFLEIPLIFFLNFISTLPSSPFSFIHVTNCSQIHNLFFFKYVFLSAEWSLYSQRSTKKTKKVNRTGLFPQWRRYKSNSSIPSGK